MNSYLKSGRTSPCSKNTSYMAFPDIACISVMTDRYSQRGKAAMSALHARPRLSRSHINPGF
jgi:hypothetical protein